MTILNSDHLCEEELIILEQERSNNEREARIKSIHRVGLPCNFSIIADGILPEIWGLRYGRSEEGEK